jgi:hypothetical protein
MKKVPTVHELRQKGFKVRVTHVRKFLRFDPQTGKKEQFYHPFQSSKFVKNHPDSSLLSERDKYKEFYLSCKGGETIVEIALNGKELGKGVAVCSEDDNYVKKYGVRKAVAKALWDAKIEQDPYFSFRNFITPTST